MKLDLEWVEQVQVNLSAVQRRTTTLTKRRSVKKENQAAWLLKAITLPLDEAPMFTSELLMLILGLPSHEIDVLLFQLLHIPVL